MRYPSARVRRPNRTRALAVVATASLVGSLAVAADLPLPPRAIARIAAACPDCHATGYVACGTPEVAWGRRFLRTALSGDPKRGYLVTFTMSGPEFRGIARRSPYPDLLTTLRERFARARLVILEDGLDDARVLPPATAMRLSFPEALHRCVHASDRAWGCCVSDCKDECCEKSLGSPTIALEWSDADERITFHYSHTIGVSWLERRGPERRVRYACLTDAKGEPGRRSRVDP